MFKNWRNWFKSHVPTASEEDMKQVKLALVQLLSTDYDQFIEHERWINYINSDEYVYKGAVSQERLQNALI